MDALANAIEEGTIEGGEYVSAGGLFTLNGDNTATGNNTFTGNNAFTGQTTLSGGITVDSDASLERALNCTGGRILGRVHTGGSFSDAAVSFDDFASCWASLGWPVKFSDDLADPLDVDYTGVWTGMAVRLDPATTDTGVEDVVSNAYRATTSRPDYPPSGLWVCDDALSGGTRGACIRRGLVQAPFWEYVLDDASASLIPGRHYFVASGTGLDSGKLSLVPSPWCVGFAVTDKVLWVDLDLNGEVVWLTAAGDVLAGQPVYPSSSVAGQLELAVGDALAHQARLVALQDGVAGDVVPCSARPCVVAREDWTDLAGVATLTTGEAWWLDNASIGHPLVVEADLNTSAAVQQELGVALSPTAMLFGMRAPASSAAPSVTHYDGGAAATVFGPAAYTIDGGGA